jgi:hypothetical protein
LREHFSDVFCVALYAILPPVCLYRRLGIKPGRRPDLALAERSLDLKLMTA